MRLEARGAKSGGVPNIRRVSRFEETLDARLESHGLEKHLGFSPCPVSVSLERTVKAARRRFIVAPSQDRGVAPPKW